MRRLDIGIASYGSPEKLRKTVETIRTNSVTDWRILIVDNPHPELSEQIAAVLTELRDDPRIEIELLKENVGYAGAVNRILAKAETEYIAYCDNDVVIRTRGWDEMLCSALDKFHEIGMIFPNRGAFEIPRGNYEEILWGVGFCWILNRLAYSDTGEFDTEIGHQEEADYALRLRMAGYKLAALPAVQVHHDATATNNPASQERISRGVVRWVNKWCRYFCGKNVNYHSPNVLRWEDWPPNALYLEEYWQRKIPELNENPITQDIDGREYDFLLVPRLAGFYRGRII